jgi:hypothetical protein
MDADLPRFRQNVEQPCGDTLYRRHGSRLHVDPYAVGRRNERSVPLTPVHPLAEDFGPRLATAAAQLLLGLGLRLITYSAELRRIFARLDDEVLRRQVQSVEEDGSLARCQQWQRYKATRLERTADVPDRSPLRVADQQRSIYRHGLSIVGNGSWPKVLQFQPELHRLTEGELLCKGQKSGAQAGKFPTPRLGHAIDRTPCLRKFRRWLAAKSPAVLLPGQGAHGNQEREQVTAARTHYQPLSARQWWPCPTPPRLERSAASND